MSMLAYSWFEPEVEPKRFEFYRMKELEEEIPGAKEAIVNYFKKHTFEYTLRENIETHRSVSCPQGTSKDPAVCEFFKAKIVEAIDNEKLFGISLGQDEENDGFRVCMHLDIDIQKTLDEYNALAVSLGKS